MSKEIIDFCNKHDAAKHGFNTLINELGCASMQDLWMTADINLLIWLATRPGVLSDGDLRIFSCFCVSQIWGLLTDIRSKNAVHVAEAYSVGKATEGELEAAAHAAIIGDCVWKSEEPWALAYNTATSLGSGEYVNIMPSWVAAKVRNLTDSAAHKKQAEYLRMAFVPSFKGGEK